MLLRAEQFLEIERGHVLYNLEVMQAYGQYTKLEGSTIDSSGGDAVFSRSRRPEAGGAGANCRAGSKVSCCTGDAL